MSLHKRPNPSEARAVERLRHSGLRVTEARKSILRQLLRNHGPHSVDEIHAGARRSVDLDRVTVYRTVQALEQLSLVRRCDLHDGVARYEFCEDDHHHHHVTCRKCRKTQSVDQCLPADLMHLIEELGYRKVTHHLEFFGLCGRCDSA